MLRARLALIFGLLTPLMGQTGSVRFRITDPSGAVVTTAKATLLGPNEISLRTENVNEHLDIVFGGLPFGEQQFLLACVGFLPKRLTVNIPDSGEVRIEANLSVDPWGMEIDTISEEIPKPVTFPPVGMSVKAPSIKVSPKHRWWRIFR